MLFFVQCVDKPNGQAIRQATRAAHLDYVGAHKDKVKLAGPTQTEDRQAMTGSVFIIDMADRAAVEAHFANDPYTKAGLFEAIIIRPFMQVV